MLEFSDSGDFRRTDAWLASLERGHVFNAVEALAREGVAALSAATPSESGLSASSWDYEIERNGLNLTIRWTNNHISKTGTPIVIMLQHGHGTGTGGYVQGRDFINPAIAPIFDRIAEGVWKEVSK